MIKLNKIEKEIYDEYRMNGKVWAECPRQSGKTELILLIAEQELRIGNKICIVSMSEMHRRRIINKLMQNLKEDYRKLEPLILENEIDADVVFYDEVYYDCMVKHSKKVVCLRTRQHHTLTFTWKDLENTMKQTVKSLKKTMNKKQWALEFNNGEE